MREKRQSYFHDYTVLRIDQMPDGGAYRPFGAAADRCRRTRYTGNRPGGGQRTLRGDRAALQQVATEAVCLMSRYSNDRGTLETTDG